MPTCHRVGRNWWHWRQCGSEACGPSIGWNGCIHQSSSHQVTSNPLIIMWINKFRLSKLSDCVRMSCGIVFTVCSHMFTLFWLRKTSAIVETFQLNFHVLNVCLSYRDFFILYKFFSIFKFTLLFFLLSWSYFLNRI